MEEQKKRPLILIVDDLLQNLQVISSTLHAKGFKPIAVTSGKQAFESIKHRIPDLILLDISMPEMDGFSVCKQLKENELYKDIPIIFLTARSEADDIVKGFEVGGSDYITKPFNSAELYSRIYTHLENKEAKALIMKQNAELERKNIELQESNAAKDRFFSIISHDLKNPFNSIIGFSELLRQNYKTLSSEKLELYINSIQNTAHHTYKFLENLLEWSRSQTNRIVIRLESIQLHSLIDQNFYYSKILPKIRKMQLSTG